MDGCDTGDWCGCSEGAPAAGPVVVPRLQAGTGTASAHPARYWPPYRAGCGLGDQYVAATLTWWIPDNTPAGRYTSILTLTLISI
jgi:hypothetical protein